jgi:hypothetical protein
MEKMNISHVIYIKELLFPIGSTTGREDLVDHAFIGTRLEALDMCPAHDIHSRCLSGFSRIIPTICGRDFGPTLGQCESRAVPSGLRGPVIREELAIGIFAPLNHTNFFCGLS